jgi:hypothetical protein
MKKPSHGEELTIRYQGATLRARCSEVLETPNRGFGSANFTIVSASRFVRGGEAALVRGADELPLQIERVTVVGHRNANIVSFHGTFDFAAAAVPQTSERL